MENKRQRANEKQKLKWKTKVEREVPQQSLNEKPSRDIDTHKITIKSHT